MLCMIRQIVFYCYKNSDTTITNALLMKRFQLTEIVAKKIISKLVLMGIVSLTHQDK